MNVSKDIGQGIKQPRPGCKGDPRMNRAVGVRLANPEMSLLDALIAGGFVFPKSKNHNPKETGMMVDTEGISLNQRRNQLSRRLSQEIRKHAASFSTEEHADQIRPKRDSLAPGEIAGDGSNNDESTPGIKKKFSRKEKSPPANKRKRRNKRISNTIDKPEIIEVLTSDESNEREDDDKDDDNKELFWLLDFLSQLPNEVLASGCPLNEILTNTSETQKD